MLHTKIEHTKRRRRYRIDSDALKRTKYEFDAVEKLSVGHDRYAQVASQQAAEAAEAVFEAALAGLVRNARI